MLVPCATAEPGRGAQRLGLHSSEVPAAPPSVREAGEPQHPSPEQPSPLQHGSCLGPEQTVTSVLVSVMCWATLPALGSCAKLQCREGEVRHSYRPGCARQEERAMGGGSGRPRQGTTTLTQREPVPPVSTRVLAAGASHLNICPLSLGCGPVKRMKSGGP